MERLRLETLKRLARGGRRRLFALLYWDRGSADDAIFIAGAGRSGTTWLSYVLAEVFDYRVIFEPFWLLHLRVGGIEDFFHHRYIPEDDHAHDDLIRYVIGGRYRHQLTNHQYRFGPFEGRVVKDICANLFLHRLKELFPRVPIVFIVRHPCAVVLSRLKRDWGRHAHLFHAQTELIDRYFGGRQYPVRSELEDHAVSWSYENYLPLVVQRDSGRFHTVYYERLVLEPKRTLEGIVDYVEAASGRKRKRSLVEASQYRIALTRSAKDALEKGKADHLRSWANQLSPAQIKRTREIAEHFQLGWVIDDLERL